MFLISQINSMYKEKRILGIITARGGSKGIPGKNIKPLAGKPLITYTIEAANKSAHLTRCIVSTDDRDIADVAKAAGADIPFLRPAEFATDESSSMSVIQHAIRALRDAGDVPYDYIMILQPTSPLRIAKDIDACIEKVVDTDADSVISLVRLSDISPAKLKTIQEDCIVSMVEQEGKQTMRRQESIPTYMRNGAVYVTKRVCIEDDDLFGKVSRPYVMPRERSVDINEPMDLAYAEFLIAHPKES